MSNETNYYLPTIGGVGSDNTSMLPLKNNPTESTGNIGNARVTTWANRGNAADHVDEQVFFSDLGVTGYSDGVNWSLGRKPPGAIAGNKEVLLRYLKAGTKPCSINVLGDSTGADTTKWVYQLANRLSQLYPGYTHDYFAWNDTTQQYDVPTRLTVGSNGAAYISTGSQAQSWVMSIADSISTSIVGDIDIRAKINLAGNLPSAQFAIASKFGNAGNRSWRLELTTTGALFFDWSVDGTTLSNKTCSAVLSGARITGPIWVRAAFDVDTGDGNYAVKFYTSPDNVTWTQIGVTGTGVGVQSIFDSTSTTQFIGRGTGSMAQQTNAIRFYELEVYGSINGTNRVIDIDCGVIPTFPNTFTDTIIDDVGNTVSISMSSTIGSINGSKRYATFNGSLSGSVITYHSDVTRFPKLNVGQRTLAIINHSKNSATDVYFRTAYKVLTDAILAANPDAAIIAMIQNPNTPGTIYTDEHAIRCQQIVDYATSQHFDYIDIFSQWDIANNNIDGVHASDAGKLIWAQLVYNFFEI